jgi:Trypsin-like peptidase domain/PEGA domain
MTFLRPSRFALTIFLVSAVLQAQQPASGDTLRISSKPTGATVEIDGVAVGTTPFEKQFPGSYFHKPHSVFSSRLEHAMVARISLPGYSPQVIVLTEGPTQWLSFTGKARGSYWLLKGDTFAVTLVPVSASRDEHNAFSASEIVRTSTGVSEDLEDLVHNASPAVVRVQGDTMQGSGFFVSAGGVVVTNRHVVENQKELTVVTSGGREYAASVIYADPNVDLAFLKVSGIDFPFLPLAQLPEVKPGETVVAIGNPGGGMTNTVTDGIVSAVGPDRALGDGTWIQTDAAINPGNSGGPLLDDRGFVVGVNTLHAERNGAGQPVQEINFALSAQTVFNVLQRQYPQALEAPATAPERGFGTANVISDPLGAEIYVDGKFVGDTPSTLRLSAGPHKIRIEAEGKKPFERDLNVLKDSQVTLNAKLEPQP